jgi:hypothetical protein
MPPVTAIHIFTVASGLAHSLLRDEVFGHRILMAETAQGRVK